MTATPKTVETVSSIVRFLITGLKPGVNEKRRGQAKFVAARKGIAHPAEGFGLLKQSLAEVLEIAADEKARSK